MKNYKKISLVIPSFKAARLISFAIESVLQQGYPNLELVVIDGGGDEDTVNVIKKYAGQLAYWCSEKDNGQYDAINKGFSMSTGDILCWLNADDMLLPRSLFVVNEIFSTFKQVHWISTLQPGQYDASGYLAGLRRIKGFSREAFLDGMYHSGIRSRGGWIQQESTFWTRELWLKAGARIPDYKLAGDFALWAEFYKHEELWGVEYPLAGFRTIEGQRSEAINLYTEEARLALQNLRQHCGWTESILSKIGYGRIRILRTLSVKFRVALVGDTDFTSKTIYNKTPRSMDASWAIRQHILVL